jgi:hypothetical protein
VPAAPPGVGWRADPAVAAQVDETLSFLTLKRRRFMKAYLDTGNAAQSALAAGYRCKDARSASDVGREILASPVVQHAYQALLEARGLSGAKLNEIHALHLSRHTSPDGGDRDRVPQPAPGSKPAADQLLDEMSPAELRHFAATGRFPGRFASRLTASSFATEPASSSDATPAPAPHRDAATRAAQDNDDDRSEDEPRPPAASSPVADRRWSAAFSVPCPPQAARRAATQRTPPAPAAPHQPTSSLLASPSNAGERPEDRVWPPTDRPATLADDDHSDEPPPPPRDWYKRDCRW